MSTPSSPRRGKRSETQASQQTSASIIGEPMVAGVLSKGCFERKPRRERMAAWKKAKLRQIILCFAKNCLLYGQATEFSLPRRAKRNKSRIHTGTSSPGGYGHTVSELASPIASCAVTVLEGEKKASL